MCSVIRKMQIKAALRVCLTLGRMATIKKGLLVGGVPSQTPFPGNSTSWCAPGSPSTYIPVSSVLFFVPQLLGAPPPNTSTPWGHPVGANSVPLVFSYRPSQAFPLHCLHSFPPPAYPQKHPLIKATAAATLA